MLPRERASSSVRIGLYARRWCSLGWPTPLRAVQGQFWLLITTGITSAEAALSAGVSVPVGTRCLRLAGGMPPLTLVQPSGRYLFFEEREEIGLLRAQKLGVRQIARSIGRDPATISRELRRSAATRGGKPEYRALVAQWKAQQAAKRPKVARLVTNDRLRDYVQQRMSGHVRKPDGGIVVGSKPPPWKRLNKPHRQDRQRATAWISEQIPDRLKLDFPVDESMRNSHEAIYQSLFIESRGVLRCQLALPANRSRAPAATCSSTKPRAGAHVTAVVVLSQRPAQASDRAVPGSWEGDLIIGTGRSAVGTIVERNSLTTVLVHLPRLEGRGENPPVKNGSALGGYGAVAMTAALISSMTNLPQQLRTPLT